METSLPLFQNSGVSKHSLQHIGKTGQNYLEKVEETKYIWGKCRKTDLGIGIDI